jgi:hypothetical protein
LLRIGAAVWPPSAAGRGSGEEGFFMESVSCIDKG